MPESAIRGMLRRSGLLNVLGDAGKGETRGQGIKSGLVIMSYFARLIRLKVPNAKAQTFTENSLITMDTSKSEEIAMQRCRKVQSIRMLPDRGTEQSLTGNSNT